MRHNLQTAAIGALGAMLVMAILAQTPTMVVRTDGLQFPDGTIQTTAPRTDTRRLYYLTEALHQGSTVLSACGTGYHPASLWEILDVSNLRYAHERIDANTNADSGSGPPSGDGSLGWVRTGYVAGTPDEIPGRVHCLEWSSNAGTEHGTMAKLHSRWDGSDEFASTEPIGWFGPWATTAADCDITRPVWCVED